MRKYFAHGVYELGHIVSLMAYLGSSLSLALHSRIGDIPATEWDACAGLHNPFLSHAFISALEDSGSTGPHTGWLPHYAVMRDEAGRLVAVVPMYAKLHSYGEYVFDQGWADAFHRAGGHYYPKLQVSIPFSPVPGPRLLLRPDTDVSIVAVGNALVAACKQSNFSSTHITFCTQDEWTELGSAGWLQRIGTQFHWHNQGYGSFEDFLAALSSRHRKSVRRERREANACGLNFLTLRGGEIKARHWDAFYRFYKSTVDRKWGAAYLTREFFTLLSERLGEKVILMMAEHDGTLVAGALNIAGSDTLYGRNWGCEGQWPFLHFELCYYRAIDFAIEHKLQRVEVGAQGEHKIQRGYLPQTTYSVHWLGHQGLSRAVDEYLRHEREAIKADADTLAGLSPFRHEEESVSN